MTDTRRPPGTAASATETATSHVALAADIMIANAPDPVFVSDLEGKILQANDAVSQLLGFRRDEVLEQSLSRFISPEETREFTAALRAVVERGVTRNARLNPRSASAGSSGRTALIAGWGSACTLAASLSSSITGRSAWRARPARARPSGSRYR
jgi:PAS domain-containing protein